MSDESTPKTTDVRTAIAANIKRIRKVRDISGRDFIAQLEKRGMKLLPSGLTALEKGDRRVTVDELLTIAVALNTSIIDLLIPVDGGDLVVAEGIPPLNPGQLDAWISGRSPWRQLPYGTHIDAKVSEEFWDAAAKSRQARRLRDKRPEIDAIDRLKAHVRLVATAQGDPHGYGRSTPFTADAEAAALRQLAGDLDEYIALLASSLERDGYGG
ncbi:helix-turn-helix domain-containing protein [Mycolicibacterium alvei]|uniref:helix-turn-helix domain-containing protein n=1 Tax=Mycolicibacterium alvei TaxID=67081 RepID=UPI0013D187B1|nr:helix-turn-helix transcriptional regulator [Mycolicibacterium alvei]MCV7000289.1 helix-turn-helix transcriptional regulator [Mycolicibacterium alvei]